MQIHRTRIGKDVIADFAVPETRSNKVAILASGMPSSPTKRSFTEFLTSEGFFVVYPRYRGTWESGGVFLEHEPTKDIRDTLLYIKKHKSLESLWEQKAYRFPARPQFYLFGGSFGGPASMLLSTREDVKKVICVAPVVDWSMESRAEPLSWLFKLLQNAYGQAFRLPKKNWDKLGSTPFYNPVQQPKKIDGSKILIFHTRDDEVVPCDGVEKFAHEHNIKTHIRQIGGHLSLSQARHYFFWKRIKAFL